MKTDLSNAFAKTINMEGAKELTIDMADATIDILVDDNSVVQNIPFVSVACSIYKIGHSIEEKCHIKKICIFINEINNNLCKDDKKEEYLRKFEEKSSKERSKELEYVLLIIGRYIGADKPKQLATLYISYIEGKMDWREFASYSEVLDRFLPGDIDELERGDRKNVALQEATDSLIRLSALGLFTSIPTESLGVVGSALRIPSENAVDYVLTAFGRKMRECLGFSDYGFLMKTIASMGDRTP